MAVNIKLKHSSIDSKAPVAADLENGEVALNINANSPAAYIKDSNGDIVKLAGAGSVTDEASVKKVGDNMTGNLTLGTDKIALDATGGSINMDGTLTSGFSTGNGAVRARQDTDNGAALYVTDGSVTAANSTFMVSGDGTTKIGGSINPGAADSPNISLNADGGGVISDKLAVGRRAFGSYTQTVVVGPGSTGNGNVLITGNGGYGDTAALQFSSDGRAAVKSSLAPGGTPFPGADLHFHTTASGANRILSCSKDGY